jgi:hypothetical protein
MREKRERLARRFSKKIDPEKLHAFAEQQAADTIIIEERRHNDKFTFSVTAGAESVDDAKATAEFEAMERSIGSTSSVPEDGAVDTAPSEADILVNATAPPTDPADTAVALVVSENAKTAVAASESVASTSCEKQDAVFVSTAVTETAVNASTAQPSVVAVSGAPTNSVPAAVSSVSAAQTSRPNAAVAQASKKEQEVSDRGDVKTETVKQEHHHHHHHHHHDVLPTVTADGNADDDEHDDASPIPSTPMSDEGGWDMDDELGGPVDDDNDDDENRPGIKM